MYIVSGKQLNSHHSAIGLFIQRDGAIPLSVIFKRKKELSVFINTSHKLSKLRHSSGQTAADVAEVSGLFYMIVQMTDFVLAVIYCLVTR